MIDLYEYYKKNKKKDSYYYFNFNSKLEIYFLFNDNDYIFYDDDQLISRLKVLSYPSNEYTESEEIECILISFYLNDNNYYIDLFPNFLERPTGLSSFSLSIREYIIEKEKAYGQTITWASRRNLAASMKFLKKSNSVVDVSQNLNGIFKKISNRNADYIAMSDDEKLAEINNVIENLLKVNDKWKTIDYKTETFDFLSDDNIIKYRKLIHCFRHGAKDAIDERRKITNNQKIFLINYGTTICELIHGVLNKNINS